MMHRPRLHSHGFVAITISKMFAPMSMEPGVGVLAGLIVLITSFWSLHVVVVFLLVVMAGGVDLLAGSRRAHYMEVAGGPPFERGRLDRGAWGKVIILLVTLFLGMCVDSLVTLFGSLVHLGFLDNFRAYTPFTAGLLLYRLLREVASIMRNIEETPGGKGQIWPLFVRAIDAARYKMITGEDLPGGGRRLFDRVPDLNRLTDEERELIERLRSEKGFRPHEDNS